MTIKMLLLNLSRDITQPSKYFFNTGNLPMTNITFYKYNYKYKYKYKYKYNYLELESSESSESRFNSTSVNLTVIFFFVSNLYYSK